MNIQAFWNKRNKYLLHKGKISYLSPYKIENQSILDALIKSKKYINGNTLDMGCGNKPYFLFFDKEKYIGIDRKIYESSNNKNNIDVYGSVLELPFKANKFDTVISTQVLEHVPEPQKMLKEAQRVLKNDGHIILTVPMTWALHEIPHDYYRFTEYGLRYLADNVGFEIIYIAERSGFWGTIGQKISSYIYYWKRVPRSILEEIIKRSMCATVQIFFLFMDRIDKQEGDSLGYIVIMKKQK